jgi:chorismate synthase
MIEAIEAARKSGNSLGGTVTCAVRGCPVGWGEPVFDRLEADLAKGMMSLPASKGFEIGSGFAGTALTGLEHNDEFFMDGDRVRRVRTGAAAYRAASRTARRCTSASHSSRRRR